MNRHRKNKTPKDCASKNRTPLARLRIATLLACLFFTLHCAKPDYGPELAPPTATEKAAAATTRVSFFALGDMGFPIPKYALFSNQLSVGKAMQRFDAERPVDAVVFLGDLFYPVGLEEKTAVTQIRNNLVRPYCRFVALDGPRASEIARTCPRDPAAKHVVPLYAVLGNHDYGSPGSPERTRELVPQFLSNWKLPSETVQVVELEAGVSLILFDSQRVRNHGDDPSLLTDAIRRSRGPWRILIAHHPIATQSLKEKEVPLQETYSQKILNAIAAAGAPVQLVLSGHEHNLQVIALPAPHPPLHVIAGSGANARSTRTAAADLKFFAQRLGFARIDLVETAEAVRLVASLYALPGNPKFQGSAPALVARYSVDREGQIRNELETDSH